MENPRDNTIGDGPREEPVTNPATLPLGIAYIRTPTVTTRLLHRKLS